MNDSILSKRPKRSSNNDLKEAVKDNFQPIGVLLKINKNKIQLDENQPRKTFNSQDITDLMHSIESQSQQQPIRVLPANDDGMHTIIFGERRWRAVKQSKEIKTLDCIVTNYDEKEILAAQLIENLQRENVPVYENANAIFRYVEMLGTAKKASKELGITEAKISRYMALLKTTNEFSEFVNKHNITDLNGLTNLARAEKNNPDFFLKELEKLNETGVKNLRKKSKEILDASKKSPSKRKAKSKKKQIKATSLSITDDILIIETSDAIFEFSLNNAQMKDLKKS